VNAKELTYATAAAVAGLAGEVEGLRRRIDPLKALPDRVQQLAVLVDQLADQLAKFTAKTAPAAIPSWLMLPADPATAGDVLGELTAWMHAVFLRYADAAAVLPDCWLWHPDVVEELLWLMHAWLAAYQGRDASVALAGDWHDRYRPGVVRRIKATAATCSLENHTPSPVRVPVPLTEAVDAIAEWWSAERDGPAPEPTEEQFAAVAPRRRMGGARR
jgi:hypothetical protein